MSLRDDSSRLKIAGTSYKIPRHPLAVTRPRMWPLDCPIDQFYSWRLNSIAKSISLIGILLDVVPANGPIRSVRRSLFGLGGGALQFCPNNRITHMNIQMPIIG